LKETGKHQTLSRFYQRLIQIRREFNLGSAASHTVRELGDHALLLLFNLSPKRLAILFNFAQHPVTVDAPGLDGNWAARLNSAAACWNADANLKSRPDQPLSHGLRENGDVHARLSGTSEFRLGARSFLILEKQVQAEAR
jgi:hypothetical protein